jgi:Zn-dependent metalloprotease
MCNRHKRNPIHCIIPPYMSEKLSDMLNNTSTTRGGTRGAKIPPDEVAGTSENAFRNKRKLLASMPIVKRSFRSAASASATKLHREVYDANESPMSVGQLIWKEGQKDMPKSKDALNVIEGAGNVWNFYKKLFNRNSIDNAGLPLIQTIRYREHPLKPFFNAFWDGQQMFYGTGMPQLTNSFTSDLDIIAHELTHGVIDFEARLEYENQSGALNESFADVFGILVKQWVNKTDARKSDWLIGSNILKGTNALRSLKAPGTAYKNDPVFGDDPQPAHMKNFVKLPNTENGDYGGVHYNSGITNFAFYVASFELGGNAWEKTGAAWYAALTYCKLMKKDTNFAGAAAATVKKAAALFGKGSLAEKAVQKGWKEAGVL